MLDMGFAPVVERIVKQTRDDRQTLLFSATLDSAVEKLARKLTRDARRHELAAGGRVRFSAATWSTASSASTTPASSPRSSTSCAARDGGRTLVFVRTKRGADRLVKRLKAQNVSAAAMHGDKTQGQRERALANFTNGTNATLIATDVAARGLDVDGITHVINFDIPGAQEDYVHRVGRTGRAGATGIGVTFVIPEQAPEMRKMARALDLHEEFERAARA